MLYMKIKELLKAVKALEDNNLELFGQLMVGSHVSLRDDYEVTGIELDTLVSLALKQDGVIGSRIDRCRIWWMYSKYS